MSDEFNIELEDEEMPGEDDIEDQIELEEPLTVFVRGSFVLPLLLHAAKQLNIVLEHPPTDKGPDYEIEYVNSKKNAVYIYFASWANPTNVMNVVKNLKCPKIFWNLEDPNHFRLFHTQAQPADFIFTSASELIPTYQQIFTSAHVASTWWACDPLRHYPREDDLDLKDRKFDIIFVGNRYPREQVRCLGESAVLVPALKWAMENNLKAGVFGLGNTSENSWRGFLDVWLDHLGREPFADDDGQIVNDEYTGVYQRYTNALDVGHLYRQAKVVICLNEQDKSPTMTSMRTYEAAGCGNVCLSHYSEATEKIFGDRVYSSRNVKQTVACLEEIFDEEGLITNDALRNAHKAMIYVHENHTYYHRLRFILDTVIDKS